MTTRSFTQDQFDAAVAELTAAGVRPTVRKLRQRLGSGSHETLGPMLAQWRGARASEPASTPSPAAVQARATELAAAVWAVAQQQAAAELDAVRQRLEAAERTLVDELADARLDIAELESTCTDLRRSLAGEVAAREGETRLRIEAVGHAERLMQLDVANAELRLRVDALSDTAGRCATKAARQDAIIATLRSQLADAMSMLGQGVKSARQPQRTASAPRTKDRGSASAST